MSAATKTKGLQRYSYRGFTPEQLNEFTNEKIIELFRARQRRRFARRTKNKYNRLYAKCRKSKKNTQPGEKPAPVKTHLRDTIVMPEMVGNFVSVYNGKVFVPVEIKFDMIGRYLGEFALTYKITSHGKAGVGATKGSAHTSLR